MTRYTQPFTAFLILAGLTGLPACIEDELDSELEASELDSELEASELESALEVQGPGLSQATELGLAPSPAPTGYQPCGPDSGIDTGIVTAIHDLPLSPSMPIDCAMAGANLQGWIASATFAEVDGQSVPQGLQRYCTYTFPGGQPTQTDYDNLYASLTSYAPIPETSAAADCSVMSPMAGLDGDTAIDSALYDAFRDNVAAVDTLSGATLHAVGLYVLDQIQEWEFGTTTDHDHGHNMGYIARDILCPDAASSFCEKHLHFELALSRWDNGEYEPNLGGGDVGSYYDTTQAAYRAIMRWRAQFLDPDNNDPELRAVLMAAFGASKDFQPDFTRGSYAAYNDVLELVACNGGLFVGSAGNATDPGCVDNEGPLSPASHGDSTTPSLAECVALGVTPVSAAYPVTYADRPLVEAVGMVDAWDELPALSRDDATPPLVAYGTQVWVPNPTGNMVPLTGTSTSTAAAAATLALVWALDPTLTAAQVADVVYDNGYDTGMAADFATQGVAMNAHRLSVCASVHAACGSLATCPPLPCAGPEAPHNLGHRMGYHDAVDAALADPANTVVLGGALVEDLAPVCLEPVATDMAHPTPENPACPDCNADVDDGGGSVHTLHVDLLQEYKSGSSEVLAGALKTFDVTGMEIGEYDLTGPQITAITAAADEVITDIDFTSAGTHTASVAFTLANGREVIGDITTR